MKILYFAWIRTKTGVAAEDVDPPASVTDVASLIAWLKGRGAGFAEALDNPSVVRVAVNQEYAKADHPVRAGDEIAIFPPVTGG
ncbi:MAG TPA: molybdopterin converting factor subunit 1 [Alphaproteobacteria bacterium]|nr:molybdopterin converting factor subunit 1 [Alphaproteobacteria bacterium]